VNVRGGSLFFGWCEASTNKFDILLWWRVNAPKYHILVEIARNILVIYISTVACVSAFRNRGCILDPFRSLLSPLTVEALVCTQDWLKSNEDLEYDNFIEIFDEYDKCL
jgi:hypothetical protein